MKTSERLDKIAEALRLVVQDLRRLEVDLPQGRTLDLTDYVATRANLHVRDLMEEASALRRGND
jgi:hypothetical protein